MRPLCNEKRQSPDSSFQAVRNAKVISFVDVLTHIINRVLFTKQDQVMVGDVIEAVSLGQLPKNRIFPCSRSVLITNFHKQRK